MLISPAHRYLSSPSPSPSPNNSPSISVPKNPRKQFAVLDEDAYLAAIEKIVERDYFPDISKLRDRLDWFEAIKTVDPIQILDAQLKIFKRRRKRVNNSNFKGSIRTRYRTQTPGPTFTRNFNLMYELDGGSRSVLKTKLPGCKNIGAVDDSLSLNKFFKNYTSEDNGSFAKILEKVNRKRKERYGHFLEGEKEAEDYRWLWDI